MPNQRSFLRLMALGWVLSQLAGCYPGGRATSMSVRNQRLLDSVPSGSGIVVKNGSAYIVGDDATGIYRLDLKEFGQSKIPIPGLDGRQYREARKGKHDFESASLFIINGKEYLLALGSGSVAISGDSALLMSLSEFTDCRIASLTPFYAGIRTLSGMSADEWNIEGATSIGDSLLIANRGNNSIMVISLPEFIGYVFDGKPNLPRARIFTLQLPEISGRPSRLSGLCTIDNHRLLFCASVEDTPDWKRDGPILGSFVGVYSMKEGRVSFSYGLKNGKGEMVKEKIESVDLLSVSNNKASILAICDNDDGTSNLFWLTMKIK